MVQPFSGAVVKTGLWDLDYERFGCHCPQLQVPGFLYLLKMLLDTKAFQSLTVWKLSGVNGVRTSNVRAARLHKLFHRINMCFPVGVDPIDFNEVHHHSPFHLVNLLISDLQ